MRIKVLAAREPVHFRDAVTSLKVGDKISRVDGQGKICESYKIYQQAEFFEVGC